MKILSAQFRSYLADVKKSSPNTLDAYMRDVNQFFSYCTMNGTKDILKVNKDFLHKYIDYLTFLGKSEATKSRILASIRCFFRFLISINVVTQNPVDSIKMKKQERKIPGILDGNEILLLLSQPKGDDLKSIRDRAMIELLYATGIKVSEIIALKVSDVNLQLGLLHLGDERHERIIPIYPTAIKHLGEYIHTARPALVQPQTGDRLFTNMNGMPISRQGFWKVIKHYADMANIKKEITPHTLRHSFAAHLLENGAQLKDIKEMLGHSDISSTQVYAQFVKNKYALSYSKFHPLAK